MGTQKEVSQFFRLALRLRLVDTSAVEQWVDSVIAAEPAAHFPFTELAYASRLSSSTADELLGQVTGPCDDPFIPIFPIASDRNWIACDNSLWTISIGAA